MPTTSPACSAHFIDQDRLATEHLTNALRSGRDDADTPAVGTALRDAAVRRATAAEAAEKRLAAELAEARVRATDVDRRVRTAAHAVVVAVAEREGDALRAIEAEAARRRASLDALLHFWPVPAAGDRPGPLTVSAPLAGLIANPPARIDDPPMMRASLIESRQTPWRDLYERLIGGDADAGLDDETSAMAG